MTGGSSTTWNEAATGVWVLFSRRNCKMEVISPLMFSSPRDGSQILERHSWLINLTKVLFSFKKDTLQRDRESI